MHDIHSRSAASAVVGQIINWKGGIYPGGATLAAYDDGEAEQLFTELERDELFIVVRTGNVIATYQSLEVGRTSNFPTEPITKQTERLRDAQSR